MYKTENHFKHAVISRLKEKRAFVTNVESHGTSVGIPDTYVCGGGFDCWIEFKNDSDQHISEQHFKIPYRPGQLAWHSNYHVHTSKYVVTLMSIADGVLLLRGSGRFAQLMSDSFNEVDEGYKHLYKITDNDWRTINIARLLRVMSNRLHLTAEADTLTNRDVVNHWADTYFPFVDYDPEALWNDTDIDGPFERDKFDSKELELFMNMGI